MGHACIACKKCLNALQSATPPPPFSAARNAPTVACCLSNCLGRMGGSLLLLPIWVTGGRERGRELKTPSSHDWLDLLRKISPYCCCGCLPRSGAIAQSSGRMGFTNNFWFPISHRFPGQRCTLPGAVFRFVLTSAAAAPAGECCSPTWRTCPAVAARFPSPILMEATSHARSREERSSFRRRFPAVFMGRENHSGQGTWCVSNVDPKIVFKIILPRRSPRKTC